MRALSGSLVGAGSCLPVRSGGELAWRPLALSIRWKAPTMNDVKAEPRAAVLVALEAEPMEEQWANALDCGALGPSRDEPQLFYQVEKC